VQARDGMDSVVETVSALPAVAEDLVVLHAGEVLVAVAVVSQDGVGQERHSGDLSAVVAGAGGEVTARASDEAEALSADAVGVGHAQPRCCPRGVANGDAQASERCIFGAETVRTWVRKAQADAGSA
jgi:hypothetical protein